MIIGGGIAEELKCVGASLKPKSESRLMKLAGWLLSFIGTRGFMEHYVTTIGSTIYYPTSWLDPYDEAHWDSIAHELVHIRQKDDMGGVDLPDWLWMAMYLLFPVPFYFAWFRWRCEREAYLVQLRVAALSGGEAAVRRTIARVVDNLWYDYGRTWPRSWMTKWFDRRVTEMWREWTICR